MFKSILFIIQTAFCPSYPPFYLCHGIAVIVPDSHVSTADFLFQHESSKGVVFLKLAATVL